MGLKKKKRLKEGSNSFLGDNWTAANHTFVVCAYGESRYLEECLLSLSIQTISSQIVIATSTPNEMIDELAEKFDIPVCVNYGESGIAGDWNFALSCAETPLVTIAHQDDVYSDRYVEWMLESLNQVDKPLLYFTNYGEIRNGEYINDSAMNDIKRLLLKPLEIQSMQKAQVMKRGVISLGNSICCPSVTYCMDALPRPVFSSGMRSNLDWEAWERFSRLEGEFVYDNRIGMYHRIHNDSETSACIVDDTRTKEDLMMLKKFWPDPIANLINKAYTKAQRYN